MKATRIRYSYELVGLARDLRRNMTPADNKLWYLLKTLPQKFRRQRPIGKYIVDFYCPEAKLVVEVDGESHFNEQGKAHDAERTAYLQRQNLHILRFTNAEVTENLEGVYQQMNKPSRKKPCTKPTSRRVALVKRQARGRIYKNLYNQLVKPLCFVGSSLDDLRNFPEEARKQAGFELFAVQQGLEPSDWKTMNSIGPGVREIRVRVLGEWRVIYLAKLEDAVYVLHAFQKKTPKTSKSDLELARKRYRSLI